MSYVCIALAKGEYKRLFPYFPIVSTTQKDEKLPGETTLPVP